MIETLRVDQWLYTVLSGDPTLKSLVGQRIYGYVAPEDAALPYVVYSHQAGHDVQGVGPARIMANLIYQVKAIGSGSSFVPLRAIADRIDALLQGASGGAVDGRVLMCIREQPIEYVEIDDGIQYRHVGGIYRLWVQ